MVKSGVTRGHGLLEEYLAKKRINMANFLIPESLRFGRVLDIGCGTVPLFLMSTIFEEKYGIDPAVNSASSSEGIYLATTDIVKDAVIPFESGFFNVVTMLAVLEHIQRSRLTLALKEIRRILKPGGRFIITTPAPWSGGLLRCMALVNLVSREEIDDHKGAYSHKDITGYLEEAGFENRKIKTGYFEVFLNSWAYAEK